jgi:hypothetical protein
LDDLLEGLQADLGVLAAFLERRFGAGADLCEGALLVFDLLLGGGADVLHQHGGHVRVHGLEHVFYEADPVDDTEAVHRDEDLGEVVELGAEGFGVEHAGVEFCGDIKPAADVLRRCVEGKLVAGHAGDFLGRHILLREGHRLDDAELHVQEPAIDQLLGVEHGELGRDALGHAAEVVVHIQAGGGFDFDAALADPRGLHEADFALTALRDLHAGAED